jgi:hypothetical protein
MMSKLFKPFPIPSLTLPNPQLVCLQLLLSLNVSGNLYISVDINSCQLTCVFAGLQVAQVKAGDVGILLLALLRGDDDRLRATERRSPKVTHARFLLLQL